MILSDRVFCRIPSLLLLLLGRSTALLLSLPPLLLLLLLSRLLLLSCLLLRLVLGGRCLLIDKRLQLYWRLAAHLTRLLAPETTLLCVNRCDHRPGHCQHVVWLSPKDMQALWGQAAGGNGAYLRSMNPGLLSPARQTRDHQCLVM